MSEVFFSRIMYERTFSVSCSHACHSMSASPATHFPGKKIISSFCSHVVMRSICIVRSFVLHFIHRVADVRSCYALDSANSTATGLDRLPSVIHFFWLYKFGSLVNNHQKIRLMMLHIYVTPSILNYKAFQLS